MLNISKYTLSAYDRRLRLIKATIFAIPVILAFFYDYTSTKSPFFCLFRSFTGIPCPGCGLTRSFIAIARGDFADAISYHLFGIVIFVGFAIASLHLILELITNRKIIAIYAQWVQDYRLQLISLCLILNYHLFRLCQLWLSGALITDFQQSPLAKLILR